MAKLLPILQSKWFAAIFSAVSFLSISVFFTLHAAKTLVQKPAPAAAEQPADAQDVAERNHNQPSWNFTNPEIDELVRDSENLPITDAMVTRDLTKLAARIIGQSFRRCDNSAQGPAAVLNPGAAHPLCEKSD